MLAPLFQYIPVEQTFNTMSDILYIVAIILVIGWFVGVFVYSIGSLIHILLVIAVIAILLRLIRGRDL